MNLNLQTPGKYYVLPGLIAGIAIFFQLHFELKNSLINLNLADPVAMVALAIVCLNALLFKQMPQWRIPAFNKILLALGLLLLTGFFVGWMNIGITGWALGARLVGAVILLGYLSAGYLIVRYAGIKGIRRLLWAMSCTALAVIAFHLIIRTLSGYGIQFFPLTPNFEGFSGNRNAFAFQLLAVFALLLVYSKAEARRVSQSANNHCVNWKFLMTVGFLCAGTLWTGSRAAILAGMSILIIGYFLRQVDRKLVLKGLIVTATLWGSMWLVQSQLFHNLLEQISSIEISWFQSSQDQGSTGQSDTGQSFFKKRQPLEYVPVQSAISQDISNEVRFTTFRHALEMWRNSPFIGEGLGVFINRSPAWFGYPTVIHNTPLWILAEFGLLGAIVFGWAFLKLGLYAAGRNNNALQRSALLLLLVVFIVFSMFHEMLYQRIFWLIGGALLGVPAGLAVTHKRPRMQ